MPRRLNIPSDDLLGFALWEYHSTGVEHAVQVRINGRRDEDLLPSMFFRGYQRMKGYERQALRLCRGSVLDIGAGAGCHSLLLQQRGIDVTAVESSAHACRVLTERGVERVIHDRVDRVRGIEFTTLLLLMNGLGMAGTEKETLKLFRHLRRLLTRDGQIIGDSTDIFYATGKAESWFRQDGGYYGEVEFRLRYRGVDGEPFRWLYLDPATLADLADKAGLRCEIVYRDRDFHYLSRLTKD